MLVKKKCNSFRTHLMVIFFYPVFTACIIPFTMWPFLLLKLPIFIAPSLTLTFTLIFHLARTNQKTTEQNIQRKALSWIYLNLYESKGLMYMFFFSFFHYLLAYQTLNPRFIFTENLRQEKDVANIRERLDVNVA